MAASLELNFFCLRSKYINRFKLSFQDSIEEIKSTKYKYSLPEYLFKYNKQKIILSLNLYAQLAEWEFLFYVYKGENHAYIQLDWLFRTVFDLIIKSATNHEISLVKKIYFNLDSLGNKYRKRLLLINTDYTISFDDKNLDLRAIVRNNYDNSNSNTEFFQISTQIENEKDEKKIYKEFIIKKIDKKGEQMDKDFLKNNKVRLNDFLSDLDNVLNKKENFFLALGNLKSKYIDVFNIKVPQLNKDSEYINDLCRINNLTDTSTFFALFLVTYILKNKKIFNDHAFLSAILERAKKDYLNIELKNKILIDEKIKILSTYHISQCCFPKKFDKLRKIKGGKGTWKFF